jgi:hypothetical protein
MAAVAMEMAKLCQSYHGNKKGGLKKIWIPFIKLHEN